MKIKMFDVVGDFGEDKDAAADLRERKVKPCIEKGEKVSLDFEDVTLVTQSFIHALISDVLRTKGEDVLDMLEFRNCEDVVKGIIATVVQYSLDSSDESDDEPKQATESVTKSPRNAMSERNRRKTKAKRK